MFAGMIPMVISILDRERPLQAPIQISSLECTHNNNNSNNRSMIDHGHVLQPGRRQPDLRAGLHQRGRTLQSLAAAPSRLRRG